MLDINMKENGKELTVELKGELNVGTSPELEQALKGKLEEVDKLIFDLSGLEYISSAGLRVLLFSHQTVSKNGTMIIRNLTDEVKDIFEVTGFSDAMNIE
uniref:Anti-sigma factor antagonist n=1 Tax=Eubacterium cellulosolvens (strain ATCC 43171 / JCM 9499 / 6) TaxID=633697 RepID=I5AWH5_EUBC6